MPYFVHTPRRFTRLLFAVSLLIALAQLHAQRARIIQPVDDTARVTLRGSLHPLAQAEFDRGQVSDSDSTGTLLLVLGRSAEQQAALDSYVKSASMPGTALYRQWLLPTEYGIRFGARPDDIATVKTWLESNGFTIEQVSPAANVIRFSGNMGAVRAAFHTDIHRYEVNGKLHLANGSAPSIPAALAPVVRGIAALNDFYPKPHVIRGGHASTTTKPGAVRPELTIYGPSNWGTENYDVYYLPGAGDAATIYDTPNKAMNSTYSGTTWNGAGVTIGIVGDSNLSASAIADVANYRSMFLNEPLATAVTDAQLPSVVVDGNDPGATSDELEALVDVEMAEAFAPKALTTLYTSANTDLQYGLFLAMQRAVDDNTVSILNISFGACEQDLGAGGNAFINEIYEQAAAQGISITVSSGDSGSAGCDSSWVSFSAAASSGLAVNGFASTPWNVAVGGTDFDVLYSTSLSSVEQYIQAPSTTATLLGNPPYYGTALSYIPEEPWNDSTEVFTTFANNAPYKYGNGPENTLAGGGGMSSAAICSGTISSSGSCSGSMSGYKKPAFQTSLTPVDSVRDVPDVSFFSGSFMSDDGYSQYFNAAWSICSDNTVNGDSYSYTDCVTASGTTGCGGTCSVNGQVTTTTAVGGTSTAVPSMAGILALVIQSQGGQRLGQADYGIYNLAANHPSDFHDITQGNNSVLCTAGSTNCGSNSFMAGYNAGKGYDLATGIGSIDVAKFVNDWGTVKFATTTTTLAAGTSASSLSTSPLTVAHGSIVYFQVGVSPSTASGNVVLTSDNSQENSDGIITAAISNGVASFSTQALPGGTYTLYARYGGDTGNASSQSQGIQVTVSPENSSMQFNLNVYDAKTGDLTAISPASAVYGSQFYANISPYGGTEGLAKGNPATGTLTLSQNGAQLTTITLDSQGVANYEFTSSTLSPGTYTLAAAYSGDSSYKASTTTQKLTITKAPVSAIAGPTNGSTVQSTANVEVGSTITVYSYGVAPAGSLAVQMNGTSLGTVNVANGSVVFESEQNASAGIAVTASQIGVGNSATFTIAYNGDSNYQGAGPFNTTVTVAEPVNAALALSTSGNITITTPGQSGTSMLTVTPSNGFGGSVSLTCALTSGAVSSYNPTCSIPSSVSISGTAAQTASITVSTTASTTANVRKRTAVLTELGGGGIVFAGVLIIFVPRRRKLWLPMFCFVALGAALLTIGCSAGGGSIGPGGGSSGTPAGTYTFTITGANGSITGVTTQTVTIQ